MGTRLAPDRTSLGPFTVLEKADVAALFLAYGQLAMKCPLSAVETDPSIAVVGSDLACIALRGLHGVLAPELRVRGLWACHLRLNHILHWSLIPWCSIAEASWFLEAIRLAGLAFQKLALVIFPFINFGPFCKNRLVHQGVEVWIDLRSKQGPEFWV